MEKAATIAVRVLDSDSERASLLAVQVRALFPGGDVFLGGDPEAGELLLAVLSAGERPPPVPGAGALLLLPAPGMAIDFPDGAVVLPRPFSMVALQDAVQRALRQRAAEGWRISPGLLFLPQEKKLLRQGASIALTEGEASLLWHLFQSADREVPKSRLLAEVLRYSPEADSHALETLVWRLRTKLEEDPGQPAILRTGTHGYCLIISS